MSRKNTDSGSWLKSSVFGHDPKLTEALERYLNKVQVIRGPGTDETSGYRWLSELLDAIGDTLKPKITSIIHPKNHGSGIPDFGLFTASLLKQNPGVSPLVKLDPDRGVIEAKPARERVRDIAGSEQVLRYLGKYGLVLVTNYWDFLLVGRDQSGQPVQLEAYPLAASEDAFWKATDHARTTAEAHGGLFAEFLKRVMLHTSTVVEPEAVAWFLASYARTARIRVEQQANLPALDAVRTALEEALGMKFEGEKGQHFFRSTLVQTLFYGVFSGWVLWHKQNPTRKNDFHWRDCVSYLRVPVIQALFQQASSPYKLKPLGFTEVLEWTENLLNRVERTTFFTRFDAQQAVQYFYEPFLEAFDPELRKQLGVWLTPREIVRYQVDRVDIVLREELGIDDGLADDSVYVLDPCCGTGAYLIEVLNKIHATLQKNGGDATVPDTLKRKATSRVFGFEILPAPFVVSHLQLGLLLQNLNAPLTETERVGVYLTNSLTGWQPPSNEGKTRLQQLEMNMPELKQEYDAANDVKHKDAILVVLGNPPYNGFAGVSPAEEEGLVEPYKKGLISEWGIKKFNLDDLYIRFFRLAERRIAEMNKSGKGVVSFISNHSWIAEPSFVVMRKHLLQSFDAFWIENMHGNRKISEYAPDGSTSETVFAMPGLSVGIRQGVAISLWVKGGKKGKVLFRDDINAARAAERRAQLLATLKEKEFNEKYRVALPEKSNRFSFRPSSVAAHYAKWPKVSELCAQPPANGLMEKRGGALIDIDQTALEQRMRKYCDPQVDWETICTLNTGLTENAARFDAKKARNRILGGEKYVDTHLQQYFIRPFDTRYCYYSAVRPLWNEPRPTLWAQCWPSNKFLATRPGGVANPEGTPFYFTSLLGDNDALRGHAYYFPMRLRGALAHKSVSTQGELVGEAEKPIANLSKEARVCLACLGISDPDADEESASLLWMHALAIGYSPVYMTENADGIRQDWPRIPIPSSPEALCASAALGRQVAALLDTQAKVKGVTTSTVRPELRSIGQNQLKKDAKTNLETKWEITAGWGHSGKDGVTSPGKGDCKPRDYATDELAQIEEGVKALGLTLPQALEQLGQATCDIYLNKTSYWSNLPTKVWDYTIGGYQVIKKWLSYREKELLGRALRFEEVQEVTGMSRCIAALLILQPNLDANYEAIKASSSRWET